MRVNLNWISVQLVKTFRDISVNPQEQNDSLLFII